jgi:general secretion pathway protein I
MKSFLRTRRAHAAGFTLLEVLVALGIAATSLIALYTLANQLLKSTAALDLRQAALWCADNHLVTTQLIGVAPALGETTHSCTQMNQSFVIKRLMLTTPNPLFRRIELSVYQHAEGHAALSTPPNTERTERLAFLTTLLLQSTALAAP